MIKTEIEKSVLSSILFEPHVFFEHEIEPEYFTGANFYLFSCIKKQIDETGELDISILTQQIQPDLNVMYLSDMIDTPQSSNLKNSINELLKSRNRRLVFKGLESAVELCRSDGDISEIETAANAGFFDTVKDVEDFRARLIEKFNQIEQVTIGNLSFSLKSGISEIDRIIGGFKPKELVIIGGRPGDGKTSLACNIMRNLSNFSVPGCFYSLEMPAEEIVSRMACDIKSIDGNLIFNERSVYLRQDQKVKFLELLSSAYDTISRWPLEIDDRPMVTIDNIMSSARKLKKQKKIEWICIDHAREIAGWNQDGQGPKSEIVLKAKAIAKQLDITVFLLSQMNRQIEDKAEFVPKSSYLKDTGALEEQADLIIFPVVNERQGFTTGEQFKEATIHITKNRRGNTGVTGPIKWAGHYYRYYD